MLKKLLAVFFCLALIFAVGCDNDVIYDDLSTNEQQQEETNENVKVSNPLTGLSDISKDAVTNRPVSIMINNIGVAQGVQTGLSAADIVYETETEGGITRLLAVFKDISKVEKIGTVRSARYPFVDLALGHDAIYIHFGFNKFCKDHLNDIDSINFMTAGKGYARIKNGRASEHTAYAMTEELGSYIAEKFETKTDDTTPWANFAAEGETLTLDGGAATNVRIPFPSTPNRFTYNAEKGVYERIIGSEVQKDYFTEAPTQVKNLFILLADMSFFDGKTRKVNFQAGGDGYYMTNGTLQFIKWTKGDDGTGAFKFTDAEGNEIKVSAGNSWVCIGNKATCTPTFE